MKDIRLKLIFKPQKSEVVSQKKKAGAHWIQKIV